VGSEMCIRDRVRRFFLYPDIYGKRT